MDLGSRPVALGRISAELRNASHTDSSVKQAWERVVSFTAVIFGDS